MMNMAHFSKGQKPNRLPWTCSYCWCCQYSNPHCREIRRVIEVIVFGMVWQCGLLCKKNDEKNIKNGGVASKLTNLKWCFKSIAVPDLKRITKKNILRSQFGQRSFELPCFSWGKTTREKIEVFHQICLQQFFISARQKNWGSELLGHKLMNVLCRFRLAGDNHILNGRKTFSKKMMASWKCQVTRGQKINRI